MDVRAERQDLRETTRFGDRSSTIRNARNQKMRATTARDSGRKRIVGKCTESGLFNRECHNQSGYYRSPFRRRSLPIGSKFMVQVLRTDSHCPLQRTILMVASPPPSDGTLYVCVLQLERRGFTGCSSGLTVDGS